MADNSVNKLFVMNKIPSRSIVSKIRYNREYLISPHVSDELNTYRTWSPFRSFNDAYAPEYKPIYDENGKQTNLDENNDGDGPGSPALRSIFNKSGAVMMGGSEYDVTNSSSEWRISNNVPLMDSPEVRKSLRRASGCSVRELVALSESGSLGRATYSYSDFMYCKWLGKMPNTYMITLRRFPLPVDDYILSAGLGENRRNTDINSQNYPSIGCMVTWLGTAGNDIQSILKYSVSMPYTEKTADVQDISTSADSNRGPFNAIAAAFDSTYRAQYERGEAGAAVESYMNKMFPKMIGSNPYSVADFRQRDANKVYGPVDTIKRTYMRSSDGINFEQNMTLVFEYEMRSYNGINQRQAFLDLISNILNVTYTTGTFWGGGYRGTGAHQNNIFSNMKIFRASGGFSNFIDAFQQDAMTLSEAARSQLGNMSFGQVLKSALNSLSGMLLGGVLNKLGRPAKQYTQSLLSPAPVGFWHVMIGNPNHPIISVGNMILKNTTIEHIGPLGIDEFPTGLRVTCELTRGKPRDIRDIEKMYMKGNDRIYSSMSDKVLDMYEHAKEYKGGDAYTTRRATSAEIKDSTNKKSNVTLSGDTIITQVGTQSDINSMNKVLMKYFGTSDTSSILVVAKEQENGSQRKASRTASGDSRAAGTGGPSSSTF